MEKTTFFIMLLLVFTATFGQQKEEELGELIRLADSLSDSRENQLAINTYSEAEKLATTLSDSIAMNSVYYKIAIHHSKLGNTKDAIPYYKKSEALSLVMKNDSSYSLALHGLGLAHSRQLEFDTAIKYYEKSLEVHEEKVGDPRTEAVILNGLAGVYIASNDMGNTLEFSKRALEKSRESDDFDLQANILNTIGICYEKMGDLRMALSFKKQSLQLCEEKNLSVPIVLLANIGNNFHLLKEVDSALAYYETAMKKAIATNHKYGQAMISFNVGEVYLGLKKYAISRQHLEKAYSFFKNTGDEQMLNNTSEIMSEVFEGMKDPNSALVYLKEHMQWNDSLQKRSTEKKLEEFQIKYEAAEKEKEIALLDKENLVKTTIIEQEQKRKKTLWIVFSTLVFLIALGAWIWQRINKKRLVEKQNSLRFKSVIEAEQKERKRIAQDLHDSIGQSISVVKMQTNALRVTTADEIKKHKKLLMQIDHVYDELRDISHNIMPNTLITLGLVPAVKELITEINADGSLKIELTNNNDFKDLNEDQTINLYRIIQEALVNIIKHAKASLVNIDLLRKGPSASIYIKDDGVGMDASKIKHLEGIGWKNIFSRVALLAGEIAITSRLKKGTTITIHLNTQST